MCLDRIIEQYDPPLGEKRAWGVFRELQDGVTLPCFHWPGEEGHDPIPRGKWLKAEKVSIPINGMRRYESGFHKYVTRHEARDSGVSDRVLPVKLRGIRILGEQDRLRVWVADEMLVPKPRSKKRS